MLACQQLQASQNWTGNGGQGMSITILAPRATGLPENQGHIPALVQGEFVSNFSSYSAISVLDWERLEKLYDHLLSDEYDDKAREGLDLGNLAHTTHTMGGSITKTATGYRLQIHITKVADKMTTASFSREFTFWELNNLTGIRQASLELLPKMGVTLTAKAREELTGAADANRVTAQTALARGVTAQRQGTEVAALSHYLQAAAIDPTLVEATRRSSILNANISSKSMGDKIRSDIQRQREDMQWRQEWVERLKQTEEFIDDLNKTESMPYTLFYVKDAIRPHGRINYQTETVNLVMGIHLHASGIWTLSIERVLQTVYDGLHATGRAKDWGLDNWPQQRVTNLRALDKRSNDFDVIFELLNDQAEVIGTGGTRVSGFWELNRRGRPGISVGTSTRIHVGKDGSTFAHITFANVNANKITDNMVVRAMSVNGTDAETAAIDGVLQMQAITANDFHRNASFRFERGELLGFAAPSQTTRGQRLNEIIIPQTVWGDPVTSIGAGAFKDIPVAKVNIPNGITSIGEAAFHMIAGNFTRPFSWDRASVTIGENVTMIGNPFRVSLNNSGGISNHDNFRNFYDQNGMKAGTYTFPRGMTAVWTYSHSKGKQETQRKRSKDK